MLSIPISPADNHYSISSLGFRNKQKVNKTLSNGPEPQLAPFAPGARTEKNAPPPHNILVSARCIDSYIFIGFYGESIPFLHLLGMCNLVWSKSNFVTMFAIQTVLNCRIIMGINLSKSWIILIPISDLIDTIDRTFRKRITVLNQSTILIDPS